MIVGIIIGRKRSTGFPGKNMKPLLGRPMCQYPMMASVNCFEVDATYISTDDADVMAVAHAQDVSVVMRPEHLATNKALADDVFVHAYNQIKKKHKDIEFLVLMLANAPTLMPSHILNGITRLRFHRDYDSACTVSQYNWYSPTRARVVENDEVKTYLSQEELEKIGTSCDRNTAPKCYFYDCSMAVIRPDNLEHIKKGYLPQRWLGQKIYPIYNTAGVDVDEGWQMPQAEQWLKMHGFTEYTTPY